jgi:hypothetical protein
MENQTTEIQLIARFHNGQSYVFYGKSKKECKIQFIKKFGDKKGFKLEWNNA